MSPFTLLSEYRIPKREVAAEVSLLGQPRNVVKLFLGDRAENHSGPEKPSDLLNGSRPFFPAVEPPDRFVLLHRDSVTALSVEAEVEFPAEESSGGAEAEAVAKVLVELVLQDWTKVRGTVQFLMPEGRRRLIDFLNTGDRFLIVRADGLAHLINKRRIVRVEALEAGGEEGDRWP
ncbi:MAG TPA: hypothetical protein VGR67_09615 [Candidatus Polarisedimenticolia bacterium]|jgi:hypothetical protein|nr:hypothetical protein [Candidatus Polarisedimenticolia bacterium]